MEIICKGCHIFVGVGGGKVKDDGDGKGLATEMLQINVFVVNL